MAKQVNLFQLLNRNRRSDIAEASRSQNIETGEAVDKNEPATKKRKFDHSFQKTWLQEYLWLRKTDTGMICTVCCEQKKKNVFTTGSCDNYRTSTLSRHVSSSDHCEALKEAALRQNMCQATAGAYKKSDPAMTAALRSCFWMAKEDIPLSKYSSIIMLQKLNGCNDLDNLEVGKNATYSSKATGKELMECIAETIHEAKMNKVRSSDLYSILIDESTDISVSKQMVVYIRIVNEDFEPQTFFVKNIKIDNPKSDAEVLVNYVLDVLRDESLSIGKVLGFGSDGAAVMVGRKSGVAARLKNLSPHLISIHCMAHRFNLCTSQASRNITYMKDFEQVISDLYYYFGGSKSGNRACELKEIQKVLDDPQVKLKECHEIRWLAFYEAVFAVFKVWQSLVTYYEKHSDKKCQEFLKKLTDYKFLFVLNMLMDILPAVSQISLLLQKQDIDLAAVSPALTHLLSQIKLAKKGNGHYQKELFEQLKVKKDKDGNLQEASFKGKKLNVSKDQKKTLEEIRSNFCDKLHDNISTRFPKESNDVASAFHIFGMRSLSFLGEDERDQYGKKELEILIQHYGNDIERAGTKSDKLIDAEKCRIEWSLSKNLVLQQRYPRDSSKRLWKLLYMYHKDAIPNMIKLASIFLVLPYQTADCERGFSCQNSIKTNRRCSMEEKSLNTLMCIKIDGPPLEEADFSTALRLWKSKKDRRIFKQN